MSNARQLSDEGWQCQILKSPAPTAVLGLGRPASLLSGYNVQRGQRTDSSLQSQKLEPFKNTMLTRLEFG